MDIQKTVEQKLCDLHKHRSRVGILPALLVSLASIFIQREKLTVDDLWIVTILIIVMACVFRLILSGPLFKRWSEGSVPLHYFNIFVYSGLGIGWGLHFYDVHSHYGANSQNVIFTLLILVAFMTSSSTTMIGNKYSYYSFVISISFMAILTYIATEDHSHIYVVFFILIFLVFSIANYRLSRKQLISLIFAQTKSEIETKRMNKLINAVPGFVSLIDDQRVIYMANSAVLTIYPEIVGKRIGEVDKNADWEERAISFLESDLKDTIYEASRNVNGHELFLLTKLQKLEDGGAIVVSMRINELVEARNKLREQEAKAQYSAKLASLGEMAAGIAHEVNNPLTIVQGSARLIQSMIKEVPLDIENISALSGKMVETSERISKIVRSLKSLSRNGENDPMTPVAVIKIIDECLDISAQRFLTRGVKLHYPRISPNLKINCREVQIGQVFLNLLGNSIDAIKNATNPWIEIKVSRDKNWVDIFVIDSGPGIPVEIQQKIMEPFFTTKELNQGTGLGLSISKNILRDHGGELTLMTDEPHTTFRMRLPAVHGS